MFKIVRNDITKMQTEAIVNTANKNIIVGTGCDAAIYKAAGYDELLNYRIKNIGVVEEGGVFITPGFNLKAKYIIHAVSPLYTGSDESENKLRTCYKNSLELAKKYNIKSIAFPLIATGNFKFPKEEGLRIAVDAIKEFINKNYNYEIDIFLVVFEDEATSLGAKIEPELEEYIDQNYVYKKLREEFIKGFAASRSWLRKSRQEIFELSESLEDILDKRINNLQETFSQYLISLIKSKGLANSDVYNRAIVNRRVFSKIKNDENYHPKKLTALCLCIGAELNLDEAKELLARAGYALSPSDKTDVIFSFFIENKIYDTYEFDIQLEKRGLPCVIDIE